MVFTVATTTAFARLKDEEKEYEHDEEEEEEKKQHDRLINSAMMFSPSLSLSARDLSFPEEKNNELRANNKERGRVALEKRDRVVGLLEDKTTKTTVPPRSVVVPLVCAQRAAFLRGVDDDEYNTSFSSSFVFQLIIVAFILIRIGSLFYDC